MTPSARFRQANNSPTFWWRLIEHVDAIRTEISQNLRRAAQAPAFTRDQNEAILDRYAGNRLNKAKRHISHNSTPESESGTLAQFKSLTLSARSLMDRSFTSILAPVCETTV